MGCRGRHFACQFACQFACLFACLAVVCGCQAQLGQYATQPVPAVGDAGSGETLPPMVDAAVAIDAAQPDAAPLGPFGTPVEIAAAPTNATPAGIDDCTASSDALDLIYAVQASSSSGKALYEMTRATTADPFANSTALTTLNASGATHEGPRLSLDNLTLYYGIDGDIYQATRTAIGQPFGAPTLVSSVSTDGYEKWLAICDNDVVMVSRDTGNGAGQNLYEGTLSGGADTAATELNSSASEISTFLSNDCLTVYFSSNRGSSKKTQIYFSTRPATDQPWAAPQMAPSPFSAADAADNEDAWISSDQRTFVFASVRGSATTKELYISTR